MKYQEYYKSESGNYIRNYVTRPKINFKKAVIVFICVLSINIGLSIILAFSVCFFTGNYFWIYFYMSFIISLIISTIILSRKILIFIIRLYQKYAKFETRMKCCFKPSCSEYAILALQKYGTIKGMSLSIQRLKRCHPPGGEDYP